MSQKRSYRPILKKIRDIGFLSLGMSLMFIHQAQCTKALESIKGGSETAHGLIMGPLGGSIVTGGTVFGIFTAIRAGNLLLAAGILLVGVLLGWQMESINGLFTHK